jgi:hypothetical protein
MPLPKSLISSPEHLARLEQAFKLGRQERFPAEPAPSLVPVTGPPAALIGEQLAELLEASRRAKEVKATGALGEALSGEMIAWFNAKHVTLPKDIGRWRPVNPESVYPFGQINGLPQSRGEAKYTNGVILLIELPLGLVYYGHLASWVGDEEPVAQGKSRGGSGKGRKERAGRVERVEEFD